MFLSLSLSFPLKPVGMSLGEDKNIFKNIYNLRFIHKIKQMCEFWQVNNEK